MALNTRQSVVPPILLAWEAEETINLTRERSNPLHRNVERVTDNYVFERKQSVNGHTIMSV